MTKRFSVVVVSAIGLVVIVAALSLRSNREAAVGANGLLPNGLFPRAKIIGHAGLVTRFESKSHFGSYTGTAPVEASSGDIRRRRLNRAGTASSTPPCTPPQPSRPGMPALDATTTSARSRSSRRPRKPSAASSANSRTSSIGTSSTTISDSTRRRPLDTEALVGHFRPTGRCRVGDRARPTDQYQDNPRKRERQPEFVGSDLARAPTRTLVSLTAGWWIPWGTPITVAESPVCEFAGNSLAGEWADVARSSPRRRLCWGPSNCVICQ